MDWVKHCVELADRCGTSDIMKDIIVFLIDGKVGKHKYDTTVESIRYSLVPRLEISRSYYFLVDVLDPELKSLFHISLFHLTGGISSHLLAFRPYHESTKR
jgi:hypothetical protein